MSEDIYLEDGVPVSRQFGDIYFSKLGGVEETKYVFLDGNRFSERISAPRLQPLGIGELGFGSGLNFFVTLDTWKKNPNPCSVTFTSLEGYPAKKSILKSLQSNYPEIPTWPEQWIDSYESKVSEFEHSRSILRWQVSEIHPNARSVFQMDLLFGNVLDCLIEFPMIDLWFLDGFSPKKNPEMWSESVFSQVRKKSKLGTTLSTFTSAGFVRNGLASVGFDIKKQKGFGKKREMIIGSFLG